MDKHQLLESEVVTLTLDDDEVIECAVLVVFEVESKEYIALLPLDENGNENEDGDVWIYRFKRDENGGNDHELINIDDDEEYEMAVDKFDEWLDVQEFGDDDIEE